MQLSRSEKISHPLLTAKNISVWVKRDDLIHPFISGNKWRKLKHNILYAKNSNFRTLISFGGPFSNHIHALSVAAKNNALDAVGIIRGEPHYALNPTLTFAAEQGMTLHFVDRQRYRTRDNAQLWTDISSQYSQPLIIPEGGSNQFAVTGMAEIYAELPSKINTLVLPVASGGSLAGLVSAQRADLSVLGIAVLKNTDHYLENLVQRLVPNSATDWRIANQFHFGGYGKLSPELIAFCQHFYDECGIPLEPIYSGKMMYGLFQLIKQDYFRPGQRIVAIHTGGLQGIDGLRYRNLLKPNQLTYLRPSSVP